eukprot:7852038-Lingulodinium_polyedra.AAC.1
MRCEEHTSGATDGRRRAPGPPGGLPVGPCEGARGNRALALAPEEETTQRKTAATHACYSVCGR